MFPFRPSSFPIMALNGSVAFDFGEWLARYEDRHFPVIFNANTFDDEDISLYQAAIFDDRKVDEGRSALVSFAYLTTLSLHRCG